MQAKKYANVLLLALVWAGYYRAVDIANKALSPFVTGLVIRLCVFVLLTAALLAGRRLGALFRVGRAWPWLVAIGCMGFLLDVTAFMGFRLSDASTGTVLLKTDVLMVNALSALLYKERLRARDWIFSALMLAGVVLVLGIRPADLTLRTTDVFFLLSALFVSINAFLIRHVQAKRDWAVSNDTIAFYNNFITMLCFLVMILLAGADGEWASMAQSPALSLALLAGSVGQFLVYKLYYKALREVPVWQVKSLLLLIPVCTVITGWLFFGERPDALRLAGMGLVLLSAAAMLLGQRRPSTAIE